MRKIVTWSLLCTILLFGVWVARGEIVRAVWGHTKLFPELTLAVTKDASLGMEMGRYYLGLGNNASVYNIEKADRLFAQTLEIDDRVYMGWYERAHIAFLYGDYGRSIDYLEKQIALTHEDLPQTYYLLGLAQGFGGDIEASLTSFTKFLELDSGNWYVYNNIAWAQFQLGNFQEMKRFAQQGLEVAPNSPWLLMNAGMASYNLGEFNDALEYLTQAKESAVAVTESDWLRTYPKNDPKIAKMGLEELRKTIESNLELVHTTIESSSTTDI